MLYKDHEMSEEMVTQLRKAALLLARERTGVLTEAEQSELDAWTALNPQHSKWLNDVRNDEYLFKEVTAYKKTEQHAMQVWRQLEEKVLSSQTSSDKVLAPVRLLRRWGWVAAAILILAIGTGVYYLNNQSSKLPVIIGGTGGTVGTRGDVAPGTNRAILTINNNQDINLAANKTGININNTITYNDGEKIADAGQLLQLTTPRGGQYQAVLPDGSKVWLNAASSIKFPSNFSDKERRVEVTGEVYFEIEKDANKPFKVLGGGQEIEVLGTSFNVNVYDDEPIKKTTLITGKIRVSVGAPLVGAQNPADDATRATTRVAPTNILQPNEQLQIAGPYSIKKINLENSADVIAWKNGYFSFENLGLKEMAKQIERWYDISIVFEGTFSNLEFGGKMDRTVRLSDLIRFLNDYGFETTLQNRTLIIKHKT